MSKGLCLVIAIVLASAALVACSNDSATTQQTPGVTEPAPTAEPTSTPTVVPTPMPTATPTPTPTATVPADHMSKMDGDVEVEGDMDLPMDCLPGGMLDDAATVSSCNAQAMQQVKSFSFDGEFNLLALFPVEGAGSEGLMRISGAIVLPDRFRFEVSLNPDGEMTEMNGVVIAEDSYIRDPESNQWFKGSPPDSEFLGVLQLVGLLHVPNDASATLKGPIDLDDGTRGYLLVSDQTGLESGMEGFGFPGGNLTRVVGADDFLTRETRVAVAGLDDEVAHLITISYHDHNEPHGIEAPAEYISLPEESMESGSLGAPTVVDLTAEHGSNAVLVRLSKTVYVRGDIWLDTSGGPTANADGGGSRTLVFNAGDLTGTVEVQGVGYGPGAALRDIHGSDSEINFQPVRWTIGDKPATWETGTDPSSPSEVEGIAVDGDYWRVSFTKPVFVVGDVRLSTSRGDEELVERPSRVLGSRFLLFDDAPSRADYNDSTTVRGFRLDEPHYAIRGIDGRDAVLDFEPVKWTGFPRPLVPTIADCIYGAYYEDVSNIDSIRADTISRTDPGELTDAQRFAWYEFFERNSSGLMRSCVALWSEEVTEENADKRNEQYGSNASGGEGCVDWVKRRVREGGLELRAAWDDVLALLERPYLSLTVAERFALRSQINDSSDCRRYYPQLFSGRWIPLQDE